MLKGRELFLHVGSRKVVMGGGFDVQANKKIPTVPIAFNSRSNSQANVEKNQH